MPELPEVEVVKRSLEKTIINLTITNIKINNINLRYKVKKDEIRQTLGLKILNIKRRSKYLIFLFKDYYFSLLPYFYFLLFKILEVQI